MSQRGELPDKPFAAAEEAADDSKIEVDSAVGVGHIVAEVELAVGVGVDFLCFALSFHYLLRAR